MPRVRNAALHVVLSHLLLLAGLGVGGLLAAAPARAAGAGGPACAPPAGRLAYRILNDTAPVGRIDIDVARHGARTEVRTAIDLELRLLALPIYSYTHRSQEIWRNGAFQRLEGRTSEPTRHYVLRIARAGDALHVVRNGEAQDEKATLLSQLVWCPAAAHSGPVLSTMSGSARPVTFTRLKGSGPDGAQFGYRFARKGREGELWYGADGIVARATYRTRFGNVAHILRIDPESGRTLADAGG